jgi:hypothetical protein
MKVKNEAEILMWEQLQELGRLYRPGRETPVCQDRRWRFDFTVIENFKDNINLAIEIEGGAWTQGRHTRGAGFIADMEKYNHAALLGWRVLRFTPKQVLDGSAIAFIRKVLES